MLTQGQDLNNLLLNATPPADIKVIPDIVVRINICAVQYFLCGFMVFSIFVSYLMSNC